MVWGVDVDAVIRIVSPVMVSIITVIVKNFTERKPRLIVYLKSATQHPIPRQSNSDNSNSAAVDEVRSAHVNTHVIIIKNIGKKTANNVRIDHEYFPESYHVFPPINHVVTKREGGSAEILIPTLVPDEDVQISYLYFPPILWTTVNAYVKCDEGKALTMNVDIYKPKSKILTTIMNIFSFIGATVFVYYVFLFLVNFISTGGID